MERRILYQLIAAISGASISIICLIFQWYYPLIFVIIGTALAIFLLQKNFKAARKFTQIMLITMMILLPILMIWAGFSVIIANVGRSDVIMPPSINIDNSTNTITISLPISIENPSFFRIEASRMSLSIGNGTKQYDFNLLEVPPIPANSHLNTTLSMTLEFPTLSELMDFESFVNSSITLDFRLDIGLFLSSMYFRGRIENASALLGGE